MTMQQSEFLRRREMGEAGEIDRIEDIINQALESGAHMESGDRISGKLASIPFNKRVQDALRDRFKDAGWGDLEFIDDQRDGGSFVLTIANSSGYGGE